MEEEKIKTQVHITQNILSPFEKFLVMTNFLSTQIPPEVQNIILKAAYYENDSYDIRKDSRVSEYNEDPIPESPLLHGILIDKEITKTMHPTMLVWCNQCHEWHLHAYSETSHLPIFIPASDIRCLKDLNSSYDYAKYIKEIIHDDNVRYVSHFDTGYYIWPVAECKVNNAEKSVTWTILANPNGVLKYPY